MGPILEAATRFLKDPLHQSEYFRILSQLLYRVNKNAAVKPKLRSDESMIDLKHKNGSNKKTENNFTTRDEGSSSENEIPRERDIRENVNKSVERKEIFVGFEIK